MEEFKSWITVLFPAKPVINGRFTWSPAAANTNDETLLVIHSPELATHFTREMNRLWRGAELGITARMQRKLERQLKKCGSGARMVKDSGEYKGF